MKTESAAFYSGGCRLSALFRTPDTHNGSLRAVVQGPGWLGLKEAKLYVRYHEALTEAGIAVLIFDYRGSGDSEGPRERLSPARQLEDLINAVTYLSTRDDVDADRIGAFGTGGTGGGNAILLAARDVRVRAVVSQVPVADGADWLHRMRKEHEWLSYLAMLNRDRQERVVTGTGRLVHPREEIMISTPERRQTTVKSDVDDRVATAVSLEAADEILAYRPIDAARTLKTPCMVIAVENDATTPTDHAVHLYEALMGPRQLVMQRHTSHYAAYDEYWDTVTPLITEWFNEYLHNGSVVVRSDVPARESIRFMGH